MEFKWQALYDRKCHCSNLMWPQGAKQNVRIYTAHLQNMLNPILEYELSTPENVDVVQVMNFPEKKKTSFSDPHLSPRDELKYPTAYYTSTRHTQSNPWVSFVYSLKCRQITSDINSPIWSFLALNWLLGQKWKIQNPIAHLQDNPNQIP